MKRSLERVLMRISACIIVASLVACGSPERYEGTYVSEGADTVPVMNIELHEDGKGVWKRGSDTFSFSWGVKGEELRLHLKDGGVLVGHDRNGKLEISLPGLGEVLFKKI